MAENGLGKFLPGYSTYGRVVTETAACLGDSMGQWKPLADGLEPPVHQLIVRLRELKDQMGVSTTTLAAKTAYSRSSWERYLNGRQLPPYQAVQAMSRVSGTDPAELLALWELAQHARAQERQDSKPESEPVTDLQHQTAGPTEEQRRPRHRCLALTAVVSALTLVVLAVASWVALRDDSTPARSGRQEHQSHAAVQPSGFACHYTRRNGRLFAGHSMSEPLVVLNTGGEQVVEVQCLLIFHGYSPGRVDGLFGEHTEKAVKEFQRADGAAADGKVGPQTWALLRA
ncbi:peptidoglycan-binding protein [Streptomyces sp. JNUCC 63]